MRMDGWIDGWWLDGGQNKFSELLLLHLVLLLCGTIIIIVIVNKTVKQLAAQPPPYRDSFWYNGAMLCYAVLAAALPGGDPLKYFAKGARRQITLREGERERG